MSQENDVLFMQALSGLQGDWEKAASDWRPPDGKYTNVFLRLDRGVRVDKATGKTTIWAQPWFQVMDGGNLDGSEYKGEYYSNKTQRSLGMLKEFLEKLTGASLSNIQTAFSQADGFAGAVVTTQIATTPYTDKNGAEKTWTHVYLREVLRTNEPAATPAATA
jgi:hypothetical protein